MKLLLVVSTAKEANDIELRFKAFRIHDQDTMKEAINRFCSDVDFYAVSTKSWVSEGFRLPRDVLILADTAIDEYMRTQIHGRKFSNGEGTIIVTPEILLEELRAGKHMRPIRWRTTALFKDGYCHIPVYNKHIFLQYTPRTIGVNTSPAIAGCRDAIEQFGNEWEYVDQEGETNGQCSLVP